MEEVAFRGCTVAPQRGVSHLVWPRAIRWMTSEATGQHLS